MAGCLGGASCGSFQKGDNQEVGGPLLATRGDTGVLMSEKTTNGGQAPWSQTRLRELLATLRQEEVALLRELLAVQETRAIPASDPPVTKDYLPKTPTPAGNASETGATPPEQDLVTADAEPRPTVGGPSTVGIDPLHVPQIRGFEILSEIGRGGMGVVYQARQKALNRLVAIKMIVAGTAAGEQDLARFQEEARVLASLQHHHIVQIFEVGECTLGTGATCPYMVLEYCAGGSLAATLDGRPWPGPEAADLIEMLARTVHAAHLAGVVHRDLKPANILLAGNDPTTGSQEAAASSDRLRIGACIPKVTDFGLAKRLGEADGRTQTGAVLGTPAYMAPEQAAGRSKAIGPRADVYALGCLLYELLTGRPPLRGETHLETLLFVVEREPLPLRAINPSVPRDLETVCLKCLRKDPSRRHSTALDLADDLRRHLRGEAVHARPPGLVEQANSLLKRRAGLAIAYTLFGVALFVIAQCHWVFLSGIFALGGVQEAGFWYLALPMAALVMGLWCSAICV